MFLLLGLKTKPEPKGLLKIPCPNCKRETIASITDLRSWFTLFFIPIIPLGHKLIIYCNVCGMGGEIKEEHQEKLFNKIKPIEVTN